MSASKRIAAVMFDMDGTLVDSKSAILNSYRDATAQVGVPFPSDPQVMEEILKLRAVEAFPRLAGDDPQTLTQFADAFQKAYAKHQAEAPGFPGLTTALGALRELGVDLGIATSKARRRLDIDLDRLGIAEFFGCTVSGDEVPHGKPAPDPINAVAAGLGIGPAEGLYVGDGENDVLAAHAAGMRAAGVAFGFHPEACRAAGPEYFVSSYEELVAIVTQTQ
jgi:HAD superfamily hydrolase (TIGR01509 family)